MPAFTDRADIPRRCPRRSDDPELGLATSIENARDKGKTNRISGDRPIVRDPPLVENSLLTPAWRALFQHRGISRGDKPSLIRADDHTPDFGAFCFRICPGSIWQ